MLKEKGIGKTSKGITANEKEKGSNENGKRVNKEIQQAGEAK